MGTKLRFLNSDNPKELEGLIEALPFKVEIKSIYHSGGKHFVWFTVQDNQSTNSIPDYVPEPKVSKTKKKTKTKKKK